MAGALLAQAGLLLYRDSQKVEITEDYLIAGVLRARVAGLELETLQHSVQVYYTSDEYFDCICDGFVL